MKCVAIILYQEIRIYILMGSAFEEFSAACSLLNNALCNIAPYWSNCLSLGEVLAREWAE
jgi:hypothetical protein